jgi:ribosomal protein S18 acetylase RimI-like enzyme
MEDTADFPKKLILTVDAPGGFEAGRVVLTPNKKGEGVWLSGLFVEKEWRGNGVARHLMDQALEIAEGHAVILEVEETNERAVGLYQKLGFNTDEVIQAKNGNRYLRMSRKA